jgi:transglutaminase-like putative cysteine protease
MMMAKLAPLSQDKANTLLLLVTCVLVLAPHASHLPLWISLTCCAALLWRGWITFRGKRMPPRALLVPIAVLSIAAMYWQYHTLLGREVGLAMLVLLLGLKLLEMHAKRDLFVVLFLGFFLVLAHFFYSQSIGTALLTIVAALAILTTQLSFQYTGAMPPLKQRLRLGGLILLLAAPLTLVLFLLFPRIQGPLWGMPVDAQSARTGLSDSMSPGNISSLAQSDAIAFRVKFIDVPPTQPKLYWRGPVLGVYDGRTWMPMPPSRAFARSPSFRPRGEPIRYQVTMEPSNQRWLFALELPQSLPILPNRRVGIGQDFELLTDRPVDERLRYDVASIVSFDLQAQEDDRQLRRWLLLPPGFNPRTQAFAASLRQTSQDNAQLVDAVLKHFRRENFRYTLQPPALGQHVVDEFLFDTRAGFCEHYAGAFVVLMRMMGIPARVVTGYQGGEINPADGYLEVRQSDAHAWAEVWLANRGWVRVDPTAAVSPARVEQNLASAIPQQAIMSGLLTLDRGKNPWRSGWQALLHRWSAMGNAWNQWVLNYTPDRQKRFIESLGFENADWHTLVGLLFTIGTLVTAAVVIPLIWQRQKIDPVEAAYRMLCRRVAKLGPAYARLAHEGPQAYAARLAGMPLPEGKKTAIARFLACYESVRYGTMGTNSATVAQLRSLLAECR